MKPLRILIVDDNEAGRGGVKSPLASQPEWFICGEAVNGLDAVHKAQEMRPDLVLMDVSVPRADGLQTVRMIQQSLPATKVIFISQNNSDAWREREDRFRAVFEQTTGGIAEKSLDGRFTLVNDRFCEIAGRSRSELLKLRWQDITHPDDIVRNLPQFQALAENRGSNFVIEKRYVRPDGQEVWVRNQVSAVRDGSGKVLRMLASVTDISDLKATEIELRAAELSLQEARDALAAQVQQRTTQLGQAQKDLQNLSTRLLEVQDEERRRIARDLHDSAGQLLAALSMVLAELERKAENGNLVFAEAARESRRLAQQVTQEIRATSYLLHPPLLDELGLAGALRVYVGGLAERTGLGIDLSISEDFGKLENVAELAIFRVIQESLTNIHKHSGSSKAWIRLSRQDDYARVEIEDAGRGIPAGKMNGNGDGVGLAGMRERVEYLNGTLTIDSGRGGARISVLLPAIPLAEVAPQPAAAGK